MKECPLNGHGYKSNPESWVNNSVGWTKGLNFDTRSMEGYNIVLYNYFNLSTT